MIFNSILFKATKDIMEKETVDPPVFFGDLNLDQIIDSITEHKKEYNLKPFFYISLKDFESIQYRQEIMQDFENKVLFDAIKAFAQQMKEMRKQLSQADKLYYKYQKERWFVDAVETYCDAIHQLTEDLGNIHLRSRGFLSFYEYIKNYSETEDFIALSEETQRVKRDLETVKYCFLINDNCIQVHKYQHEMDYSFHVEETFKKFQKGAVKDYRREFPAWQDMNHVEANILEIIAQLYPEIFTNLEKYCEKRINYLDEKIRIFDREVQFYIAYLEHIEIYKQKGLKFCYPEISQKCKEIYAKDIFDLALANKLISDHEPIVCNDFYLEGSERIFVVSGANQGGKTTFARTFGQLHYLASLGCPVPSREAKLFLFDNLFTHFEKEESLENLRGKLQDDLVRIYDILDQATSSSIIIMNEIFTSTTLKDAIFLGEKVMKRIIELDILCVCVTFIDELASLSDKTVSLVSAVIPENPALRTYKIVRKPAEGLSYAKTIAEKHRLTYDCLKERLEI